MEKLCVVSVLALAGCGGGGSQPSTAVTNPPLSTGSAPPEVVYFREIKNAIPSLSTYYDRTCTGINAHLFLSPAVDLNKDNRKDLLILIWCSQKVNGSVQTEPSKNTLISLIQNSDGTFKLGNQELFGRSFIELSGQIGEPQRIGIGDFNGDRNPDVIFATSWEDGRYGFSEFGGNYSFDSWPDALMSQPDGTYKLERFGNRGDSSYVTLIKGTERDIYSSGADIWNYQNKIWTKSPIYFSTDSGTDVLPKTSLFLDNENVTTAMETKDSFGWLLGKVSFTEGYGIPKKHYRYTTTDKFVLSDLKLVLVTGAERNTDQYERIGTIDNVEYLMPSYNSSCSYTEGQDTYVAAEFFAVRLNEKYTGQKLVWASASNPSGNVSYSNGVSRVHLYKITNGKISRMNLPVLDKDIKIAAHYVTCQDVNGDKKVDIVVYRLGHDKSIVWLNNGNGNFSEVPLNKLPDVPKVYYGHHVMFGDLNNDGLSEIFYGPGAGYPTDYAGNYSDYQVYQGVNPL